MDFGERNVTFQEADRRYSELKRRHEAGIISDEGFDEQLRQLMVMDEEGTWWVKSRKTGDWHYHDGTAWVVGIPSYEQSKPWGVSKPSIHKPSIEELIQVCAKYDGPRFYVGDAIPRKKLARSRSSFPIPAGEDVAALLDTSTLMSGGRSGLAVCAKGLRWRNEKIGASGRGNVGGSDRGFLGWRDFSDASIDARWGRFGRYDLQMGEGNVLVARNQLMDGDVLFRVLQEIQSLVRAPSADGDS